MELFCFCKLRTVPQINMIHLSKWGFQETLSVSRYRHFLKKKIHIYFWLQWVFVATRRLSLALVSRGYSSSQRTGFSLLRLLLLWSTGLGRQLCLSGS